MTAAESILRAAIACGVWLWADGDDIHYQGGHAEIEPLLPELKQHKPELLELLKRRQKTKFVVVNFESFTLQSGRRVAFKLAIPKDKYDGIELLRMLEAFNQTIEKPE